MEHAPSKRRKTSPTSSIKVTATNTLDRAPSQDGAPPTPIRASFLSPTKASLSRFNPHLLPPPKATSPRRPNSTETHESGTPKVNGTNDLSSIDSAAQISLRPDQVITSAVGSNAGVERTSPVRVAEYVGRGLSADPRRRSQIRGRYASPSNSASVAMLQNLRASPPEAATEMGVATAGSSEFGHSEQLDAGHEQEFPAQREAMSNLVSGGELIIPIATVHATDGLTTSAEHAVDAEPRLPPTPTQLGLEPPPKPPDGLLLSSPSRRPRRMARSSAKSSPLKPRDPTPPPFIGDKPAQIGLGPRKWHSHMQGPAENLSIDNKKISMPLLPQRLSLFLPFSKPPAPTRPDSSTHIQSANPLSLADGHPNPTNATPILTTAFEDTTQPHSLSDGSVHHKQITLTSPHQLLTVKIRLNLDKTTNRTSDISLVDMSSWAVPELGTWLERPTPERDLAATTTAISRFWEICELRAQCWHKCEKEFTKLLTSLKVSPLSTPVDLSDLSFTNPPDRQEPPGSTDPLIHSRHSLPFHLGRQSLLFSQTPISLLIVWSLSFNPSDQPESHVSAHAAFPDAWMREEGGMSMGRVGEVFERLLRRGYEVFEAVKVLVGVMFPGD